MELAGFSFHSLFTEHNQPEKAGSANLNYENSSILALNLRGLNDAIEFVSFTSIFWWITGIIKRKEWLEDYGDDEHRLHASAQRHLKVTAPKSVYQRIIIHILFQDFEIRKVNLGLAYFVQPSNFFRIISFN